MFTFNEDDFRRLDFAFLLISLKKEHFFTKLLVAQFSVQLICECELPVSASVYGSFFPWDLVLRSIIVG